MNKKEDVIKSARELFEQYGYKKVSMDEIAKKSNVTKKTIYTYFKDKNDLIKYFLYEEIQKMKNMIDEIEKENLPFNLKIHKIISSLLEYRNKAQIVKGFSDEAKNLPVGIASECFEIINQTIVKEIKELLEKAIDDGNIKPCDPDLIAFLIYKMYVALMFEWDKPIETKEVTDNLMKFLKDGLFI